MMAEGVRMMKARCPKCGEVFEYPYEDGVNVVLFGNWKKYHQCKDKLEAEAREVAQKLSKRKRPLLSPVWELKKLVRANVKVYEDQATGRRVTEVTTLYNATLIADFSKDLLKGWDDGTREDL